MADHIVASKADLYQADEVSQLTTYMQQLSLSDTPISLCEHGDLPPDILVPASGFVSTIEHHHHHHKTPELLNVNDQLQQNGSVRVQNRGDGFISYGWAFSPEKVFDFTKTMTALTGLPIERLKAVMITDKGIFAFNLVDGVLNCVELDEIDQSRLEFITSDADQAEHLVEYLESDLLSSYLCEAS